MGRGSLGEDGQWESERETEMERGGGREEREGRGRETPRASLQDRNPSIETANTKDSRKEERAREGGEGLAGLWTDKNPTLLGRVSLGAGAGGSD